MTNANPNGSSAEENQAITSLKGELAGARTPWTSARRSRSRAPRRASTPRTGSRSGRAIPANLRDAKGRWTGDYWGAISIGYNTKLVKPAADDVVKDLKNPAYKGQVALNGSPLTSDSAVAGVFAAALANGGSLSDVSPGHRFLRAS